MVRFVRKEESEEYANASGTSANSVGTLKRRSGEDSQAAAVNGGRLWRVVGVSFGLLCILQAALNVSLRLTLYSSDSVTPGIETGCKALAEERDQMEKKLNNIDQHTRQGWLYFNDSLYYISSTKKTWTDSRKDCQQRGADLVIINSREKLDFTRQFQKTIWIGLTDSETEGIWKWVDGSTLTTSYWHRGEPNSDQGRNEDCVENRFFKVPNSWNDESCDIQNFWICEKTAAP
ncbi:CD209 antigen-like protein C [Centroberyx affinis]|uniref:CD209 antigen-like protein C n=1 Tax=Centroberyx affinis TaxID=166261 RepID=UPI003A5C238C